MKRVFFSLLMLVIFLLPASAQQTNISRYVIFTGYSYLTTPSIGLSQNGFDGSFGMNVNRWLGAGTDFSVFTGSSNLHFGDTTLGPQLAPLFPPAALTGLSALYTPISATTITWGLGPKVNLRKWKRLTLFAHPGLGLMHEKVDVTIPVQVQASVATLVAANPASAPVLAKLQPHLTDTVMFFGAGVGFDINASKHVGLRFTTDWVHSHMFSGLLNSQDNVRISIGPIWGFGEVSRTTK